MDQMAPSHSRMGSYKLVARCWATGWFMIDLTCGCVRELMNETEYICNLQIHVRRYKYMSSSNNNDLFMVLHGDQDYILDICQYTYYDIYTIDMHIYIYM